MQTASDQTPRRAHCVWTDRADFSYAIDCGFDFEMSQPTTSKTMAYVVRSQRVRIAHVN
jgi:hypothetical protein